MPSKRNLTMKMISGLSAPATGRMLVYDAGQANLLLSITANNVRSWYWYGRFRGRPIRHHLGRWPDISVEAARKAAKATAGLVANGVDPRREKVQPASLQSLFDRWLIHAKLVKRTWQADEKLWQSCFGSLKARKLEDLTSAVVAAWHTTLGRERGTVLANRARALLSAIFSKASQLGFTGPNPCAGVPRFPEQSRERFLMAEEMRPFFAAVKAEPPDWRDFWLLVLFTGARRGNVAAMEWAELDLLNGLWHIPAAKTKNKKPAVVVLPPPAVDTLKARHGDRGDSPFVFPGPGAAGHIKDPRKSWARVCAAAGITDLHPHDLRRTNGSWQANQGASLHIIGQALGHADHRSTAIYSRLQVEPVRLSVSRAVTAMIEAGEPPAERGVGARRRRAK
jgi:integrase